MRKVKSVMSKIFYSILALALFVNCFLYFSEVSYAASQAEAIADYALSQVGNKERSVGSDNIIYNDWYYGRTVSNSYSGQYAWCQVFVAYCANQCGIGTDIIPKTANCQSAVNWFNQRNLYRTRGSGYIPQIGDIVFFTTDGTSTANHVGIVYSVDGTYVYYVDGNNTGTSPHGVAKSVRALNSSKILGYGTPSYNVGCSCSTSYAGNYTVSTSSLSLNMRSGHGTSYGIVTTIPKDATVYVSKSDGTWAHVEYNGYSGYCTMEYLKTQGSNPVGSFDSATGKLGCVNVYGWAFDSDNTQANLDMHVYIGGASGSGAPCYVIKANKSRQDVDSVYGTGSNHGFSEDIYTYKTGKQEVYVYAINVGGGTNTLIGHKTVDIVADTEKPQISDAKIIEKDSQGYTIQCKVTDNGVIDRVLFPTWTNKNGQDDLSGNWASTSDYKGTGSEGIYTFRVKKTAHNDEYGIYTTHIYAYDKNGNYSSTSVGEVGITAGYEPQEIYKYDNKLISFYNESLKWSDLLEITKAAGSKLLFIETEEKQELIETILQKERLSRSYNYIGAYQVGVGATWQWLDGTSLAYTNWGEGQPDCAGKAEFYGSIRTSSGAWNDLPSSYSDAGFIMETPLDLEPACTIAVGNKLYKVFDECMSYELAERFCKETGGRLAIITSEQENTLIANKLSSNTYFIGATDHKKEGTFLWNDGTSLSYSNWAEGEPNDDQSKGGQDYLVIKNDGTWDDLQKYSGETGFIAEYEVVVTPTPTVKPTDIPTVIPTSEPTETPTPEPTATATPKPTATPTPEPTATPTPEPTATATPKPTATPIPEPTATLTPEPTATPTMHPLESIIPTETPSTSATPMVYELGDVDNNGKVDAADALLVLKQAAKLTELTEIQKLAADVTKERKIDATDALQILKYAARIIDSFE